MLKLKADALNAPFFKFIRTGLPWVTLKAAITLDGKLATRTGDSKWISGEDSRARVHGLRNQVDAVIVGAGTVQADDPKLTTRGVKGGRDPVRVVLDPLLRTQGQIYTQRSRSKTIVATLEAQQYPREEVFKELGVEIWKVPGKGDRLELKPLLKRLGKEGHLHVLVEGGATVHGSFLEEGLWDELWLFVAPKLFGHGGITFSGAVDVINAQRAKRLQISEVERVGDDLLLKIRAESP